MDKESLIRKILRDILDISEEVVNGILIKDNLLQFDLDSLKAIELIVNLESVFDIMIDEDDLFIENVSSIENIINVINKYIEG